MSSWFVPGRIEVLGKHTDYAGGEVLVCAVDRGIKVSAARGSAPGLVANSDQASDKVVLHYGTPVDLPGGHWGHYVSSALERLGRNFAEPGPIELQFSSTVPLASGMSSSSALVVASALAIAELEGFDQSDLWRSELPDELALAGYLACVENGQSYGPLSGASGVGTKGGSEDHVAMLCSRPGMLSQFGFAPPALRRRVAMPANHRFVVAVSGVRAEKTGAAKERYNRASQAVGEIVELWNRETGRNDARLADAVRSSPEAPARLQDLLVGKPELERRLAHFLTESEQLVPAAVSALEHGDLAGFGEVAARSQEAAEKLLRNQVPETSALARLAREQGAVAAASFGAGFGGSVWALLPSADADSFAVDWLAAYRRSFPDAGSQASVLVTWPSAAASRRPVS